ncbi:MAG: outer membrane protein assembly factor BamE [Rhodobacteraceae bacterium]|nr:outer membrane protein assembly factor BamE [Paracoccaceae bacterium]
MAGTTGLAWSGLAALRFAVAGLLLLAAACTAVYRNHGYVPTDEELAAVEVGKDTRETVTEKIGRPSAQGLLNDVGWFYVQSEFRHYGPLEPQEVKRQVVAINFTEGGVVSNIGRYGLQDGRVFEISRRVTATNIKGATFIGQLLGSIGRFNAGELLGE